MTGSIVRPLLSAGMRLVDIVLPPRCKKCGALVVADDTLCAGCWLALTLVGPPWCARCGRPFEFETGEDALCGACLGEPPPFARARTALAYDDASRELILRFKHGGDEALSSLFGALMLGPGQELFAEADLILPVPLHPWRRIRRRYNQSALLAADLSRRTGIESDPLSLIRTKRTPSQGGLGKAERKRNVRAAFAVRPGRERRIAGKHLLLVDDVMTSGATVEACIRACMKAGAGSVSVLTLARVF